MEQILAIEGMKFHAKHGVYDSEKEEGGTYIVDVHLSFDISKAGKSDKLDQTINYEEVYDIVKQVMGEPHNLIESLAYEIQTKILNKYPILDWSKTKVVKKNPPIGDGVADTFVLLKGDSKNTNASAGYWETRAQY